MSNNESVRNPSGQGFRFILIDRNGPLAEFETWEQANHWRATHQLEGSSIVRCDGPIQEPSQAIARSNAASESGGPGVSNGRGRSAQEQSLPKATSKVLVI